MKKTTPAISSQSRILAGILLLIVSALLLLPLPSCSAVKWPQGLPAPARSHWRVGSIETARLPVGIRCSIELYNISRPEA